MSASAQRPCVLQDVIAITGGGIDPDAGLGNAWMIKPTVFDGKRFGEIYVGSHLCKQFVRNQFGMVEHLKKLRNTKVLALMQELSKEEDPNEEHAKTPSTLTTPKRELVDRLPKFLTIEVTTASMVASVNVLAEWRNQAVLSLEITQPNLDLLLEEPPAEPAPWAPTLDHENVYWIASRNQVRCYYWDSKKTRRRYKSMTVEISSDMSDEAKLVAARTSADACQEYYDAHHNRENNIPEPEQDPESDGEPPESAHGEPVQKLSRTDTEHESEW